MQRRFFNPFGGEEEKREEQQPVQPARPAVPSEPMPDNVRIVHSEEELNALIAEGTDCVVKLAFTWCRPCKGFWPRYQKFARIYNKTRFVKIVGNENESCKHYARDVLKAKISPMFAAYSNGALVSTWNGANNGRFISKVEEFLPSAKKLATEREVAISTDTTIAPT